MSHHRRCMCAISNIAFDKSCVCCLIDHSDGFAESTVRSLVHEWNNLVKTKWRNLQRILQIGISFQLYASPMTSVQLVSFNVFFSLFLNGLNYFNKFAGGSILLLVCECFFFLLWVFLVVVDTFCFISLLSMNFSSSSVSLCIFCCCFGLFFF